AVNMTDNVVFTQPASGNAPEVGMPGSPDDRWVFTEENPYRQLQTSAALAAAFRAPKEYNSQLAQECLYIGKELYQNTIEKNPMHRLRAADELWRSTSDRQYASWIIAQTETIAKNIDNTGWIIAPVLTDLKDKSLVKSVQDAVRKYADKVAAQEKENPYGVPYKPDIWGAGWGIQSLGVKHYLLHRHFPEIFPNSYALHADRKSTRLNSSHVKISYAVFCLKKKIIH